VNYKIPTLIPASKTQNLTHIGVAKRPSPDLHAVIVQNLKGLGACGSTMVEALCYKP
jgi:hypothetical protein